MRFEIFHSTRYDYAQSVSFDVQWLRVQPRSGGEQRLEEFSLSVEPRPASLVQCLDAEGNAAAVCSFRQRHERLEFTARSVVATLRDNPFDFPLDSQALVLPPRYAEWDAEALTAALRRVPRDEREFPDDPVAAWAGGIAAEAGGQTVAFLTRLNQAIHEHCRIVRRELGPPLSPAATLAGRVGACRDLAVLLMDAARAQGLAARFVSGYYENDDDRERDLHAWAEVYVPGGGWRGFDPTCGLAAADRHVAVAASVSPAGAAPIRGTYYGPAIPAHLHAEISIRRLPDCAPQAQQQQQ